MRCVEDKFKHYIIWTVGCSRMFKRVSVCIGDVSVMESSRQNETVEHSGHFSRSTSRGGWLWWCDIATCWRRCSGFEETATRHSADGFCCVLWYLSPGMLWARTWEMPHCPHSLWTSKTITIQLVSGLTLTNGSHPSNKENDRCSGVLGHPGACTMIRVMFVHEIAALAPSIW